MPVTSDMLTQAEYYTTLDVSCFSTDGKIQVDISETIDLECDR